MYIGTRQVAKKDIDKYEQAPLTIKELYELGANADLSKYKGKLAKDSNYLILSDEVKEFKETKRDYLGNEVRIGEYVYMDINKENQSKEQQTTNNNKMDTDNYILERYPKLTKSKVKEISTIKRKLYYHQANN